MFFNIIFYQKVFKNRDKEKIEKMESSEKGTTIKMEETENVLDEQSYLVDKIKVIIIYAISDLFLSSYMQKILKYNLILSIKNIYFIYGFIILFYFKRKNISSSFIVMSMFMINDFLIIFLLYLKIIYLVYYFIFILILQNHILIFNEG